MNDQLSVADKFYIEQHRTLPIKTLSNATEKSQKAVKAYLQLLEPAEVKEVTDLQKQIAMKKSGFGVAIMTKASSERADAVPKIRGKNREDVVFKPNG